MSRLLKLPPFGKPAPDLFLHEMNVLTRHHLAGCPEYARICRGWDGAERVQDLPFLHVGLFKRLALRTRGADISHGRELLSSSTSGTSSRIVLDATSSRLQSESTRLILQDFVGGLSRPLLILDSAASLRRRGELSARTAAALSLQPLASEFSFLLEDAEDPSSLRLDRLECALNKAPDLLVYGFSWMLWLAWGSRAFPQPLLETMREKRFCFVHSGGWKKLEDLRVDSPTFDSALLSRAGPGSKVVDFYGLVEQVGMVYPRCPEGFRHVPVWGEVLIRDSHTLECLEEGEGQIQLLNPLSWGAPYHSVLTEDLGRLVPGPCPGVRQGERFLLLGRVPNVEVRGCANV